MRLELFNAVVLAEDYAALRDWYMRALDLEIGEEWTDRFHYVDLVRDGKRVIGIGTAAEMGVRPAERDRHAVVAQFNVDDAKAFLARVVEHGGTVVFGPSHDAELDLWFGSFRDIEGNPSWVVQMLPASGK